MCEDRDETKTFEAKPFTGKGGSCKSGVYVLRYSEECIKIGMSSNVERRLKSYQGYQKDAQPVERLMIVYTEDYEILEKAAHCFAGKFLPRFGEFEVFKCKDQKGFLREFR